MYLVCVGYIWNCISLALSQSLLIYCYRCMESRWRKIEIESRGELLIFLSVKGLRNLQSEPERIQNFNVKIT